MAWSLSGHSVLALHVSDHPSPDSEPPVSLPQGAFRKIFHTDLWSHASESYTKAGRKQARRCFWLWCGMQDRSWIMPSGLATSAWLVFHHPLLFHHPNPLFFWWSELLVHSNLTRPVYRVLVNYVKKFGEKSRRYHRFKALYTFNRNFRWDRARQLGKAFRIPTSTVTDWLETAAETGYVASLILKQNFIDQVWHVFELIAERRE